MYSIFETSILLDTIHRIWWDKIILICKKTNFAISKRINISLRLMKDLREWAFIMRDSYFSFIWCSSSGVLIHDWLVFEKTRAVKQVHNNVKDKATYIKIQLPC